jgi:hypothetical protein
MPPTDLEKRTQELLENPPARGTMARTGPGRWAGGTPGGVGTFMFGLVLAICGGYLVLNQVQVSSAFTFFGLWGWSRPGGFGLTMLPMLLGIGFLFFDGKSKLGWGLCIAGALIILLAILMSLSIRWAPTSLLNTLFMFGMLAAGLGMIFRSLRAYPPSDATETD